MPPFRRSVAGSAALARRHLRILVNRPTAAILPANRLASASAHQSTAPLQPADCRILLPQRPPAAVETSIGPSHYPADCTPVRRVRSTEPAHPQAARHLGFVSTEPAPPQGARKL